MPEVLKMGGRDKKAEEELRLRLVSVTEDPTFQGGSRRDNKRVIGGMIDRGAEEQLKGGEFRIVTIH
jgi:hypothetical protein